jgi:hypothetical protein
MPSQYWYEKINESRLILGQTAPGPEHRQQLRQFLQRIDQAMAESQVNERDRLNWQVQTLIEQAKQFSADPLSPIQRTLCQREVLSQAIALMEQSGKLWRNYDERYRDAYSEAYLKALEYFYRHYAEYDPTRAQVTTWLNFRLQKEFTTQQAKYHQWLEHQASSGDPEQDNQDLLALMVSPSYGDQAKLMQAEIAAWIDQDQTLQTTTIRNQPQVTAQGLLKKRFLEEVEWGQLATDYRVSVATLSSFYERQCRPRLIQFVEANFDYWPPDTPINPCEHLRKLTRQSIFQGLNLHDCLAEWVASDPQLQSLTLRSRPEITARQFLEQVLRTIQRPRQGLVQVAEALGATTSELERFYEFQLMPLVLDVLHKKVSNHR